jgi:hypothetical protein
MHTQLAAQNDMLAYSALVNDIAYGAKRLARTGRSSIEQGQQDYDAAEGKRTLMGCIYVENERKNQELILSNKIRET